VHLVGIIYYNIITMHGPVNIKRLSMLCQNGTLTSIYELITCKLPCAHRSELNLTAHPVSVLLVDCSRMAFRKFLERNSI